jgi:hypothetical protein
MSDVVNCLYCKRALTPATTTTNTNGNLGRRYVLCTSWPEGEFGRGSLSHQRFFRWVDRTPSPSSTPPVVASLTTLPSPPPTLPPPAVQNTPIHCYFIGCKSNRLPAQNCTRRMCRTHCQLSGGCPRKDHINKAATSLPATFTPLPAMSTPTPLSATLSTSFNHAINHHLPPPDLLIDPLLRTKPATSQGLPTDPPLQAQPVTNILPPTPHSETPQSRSSRHAVQIPPVFTEQQAALQRADADRRIHQATVQRNESQSKNIVRVFAWSRDECDPTLYDFALPPGSRSFEITESVLHDLVFLRQSPLLERGHAG